MDVKLETRLENIQPTPIESGAVRFDKFFKAFPRPIYIWQYRNGDLFLIDNNDTGEVYRQDLVDALLKQGGGQDHPDADTAIDDILHCYQEKTRFKRELLGYRLSSTGEVRDLVITYAFIQPGFVMMSIKDVTDERAVLNKLQRLSNAVEQTADIVFITDRNGIIEYVNPAFEHITGYSQGEVLGKTPRVLKSGEMPQSYYRSLWKTILDGKPFQTQTTNHRRDGTKFVVDQTITPIRDQAGKITHFVSVLKDVTERIQFQEQETEHRLAGRLQQSLFPKKPPKIEGYDIAGAVFPAKFTSGDCFDFIPMKDGTTGIVVGDVCGHGLSSALIMAETRAYLRSLARFEGDPRLVLGQLNEQIYSDLATIGFITISLARLDPRSHVLEYANAGNWPAYIFDVQGNVRREIRTGGYPIGVTSLLELEPCAPIRLAPGEMVIFLTDGIPEALNATDTGFGIQKLLSLIQKHRAAPAEEIIQMVREEVLSFLGAVEPEDDQTLVICKRVQQPVFKLKNRSRIDRAVL
jgi:PAS domain S-box-containing protein